MLFPSCLATHTINMVKVCTSQFNFLALLCSRATHTNLSLLLRGLGLGASYFDMLGSKYCFQCAFFICYRKYQAHIYLQLKERFLSPVMHYVLPQICFEAFVFVLLNNVDNHKVRHQNGLKRFSLYKLLASEFFSLLTRWLNRGTDNRQTKSFGFK